MYDVFVQNEIVQMKNYLILIITFMYRKTVCHYYAAKKTNGSSQINSYKRSKLLKLKKMSRAMSEKI